MSINGISSDVGGPSGTNQVNTKWTRPTVSTIKVEPHDTDQPAYISVSANGADPILVEVPGAGLTWTITSTGAIGGTRGAAEAANTGYEIYVVAKAGGADPALISEVNGTALTYAALAAVDADYVLKSAVVSFGSNTGGGGSDLLDFNQWGGSYEYQASSVAPIVAGKTTDTSESVPAEDFVPFGYRRVTLFMTMAHSTTTANAAYIYRETGHVGLIHYLNRIGTFSSGYWSVGSAHVEHTRANDPTALVHARLLIASSGAGMSLYVLGFEL